MTVDKDKILKLLKSGIWEDALLAFNLMRNWTFQDVHNNFDLLEGRKLDLGNSSHINKYVKINDGLYVIPGRTWTIRFHNYWNQNKIDIII